MAPREYDWMMGDTAALGDYVPERPDPMAGNIVKGIVDYFKRPGQTIADNPYPPGSEEAQFFEDQRKSNTYRIAPEAAQDIAGMGTPFAVKGALGMAGGKIKQPTGFEPGGILGIHPTSTAEAIHGGTLSGGGYSVHLPTGVQPTEGLMVGRYKNTDPRNMVVPREEFTPGSIAQHAETNAAALGKQGAHLGTWVGPDGKVYLDVAQQYPADKIRVATKAGERTGQLAGYNVGAGESFPIGNWRDFVASPEFRGRVDEMADVGRKYLDQFPTKEWWNVRGSPFERVYGEKNIPQIAGFSAATAPVSNPYNNMQMMSEYMRRHIKGEPIIQPDFRLPETAMGPQRPGTQMPMEVGRSSNLLHAAAGDIDKLRRAKVRAEGKVMMGDPEQVVLDTHWSKISEDPSRGIFANVRPGVIDTNIPKRGVGDYDYAVHYIGEAARGAGQTPAVHSSRAWTGIRETIKNTGQLFGTPYRSGSMTGESKSYADVFQEILEKKAKHMGISVDKLDARLRRGDADLLSTMMVGSPVLWGAYKTWEASEAPGSLAKQDQYQ